MPNPLPPLPASIVTEPPLSDEDLARLIDAFGIGERHDSRPLAEVLLDPAQAEADPMDPEASTLRLIPEDLRSTVQGFRVANIGQAEWAMRHLRDAIASVEQAEAQAAAWRDEIDRWLEQATRAARGSGAYFHGLLMDWGLRTRRADDKAATLPLPSGTVETTKRKPAPKVDDAGALLAWAETWAPDAVEVVPEVRRVPAAAAKALGEIVTVTPAGDDDTTGVLRFVAKVPDSETAEVLEVEVPGMTVTAERIDVRVKPGPANVG